MMKTKTIFFSFAILILIVLTVNTPLIAHETIAPKTIEIQVYSYNFSEPSLEKQGIYDTINIPGTYLYGEFGSPLIPVKTAKILLPQNSKIKSIEVKGDKMSLPFNYYIKPYQGVVPISFNQTLYDTNIIINETIYNSKKEFPKNLYSIESIQNFMGYKILILNLYPVQYIPKTGKINYYKNLTLQIETEISNISALANSDTIRESEADKVYLRELVDNPEIINNYSQHHYSPFLSLSISDSNESYDYLIITNNALNSSNLSYTFQNLSDWKAKRGIKTKIVTIEQIVNDSDYFCDGLWGDGCGNGSQFNDTQAKIRNFIKDAYHNWGIRYVLLGGDDEIIPHRGFYCHIEGMFLPLGEGTDTDIPSDLYYGCLDGSFNYNNNSYYGEIGDGEDGGEVDIFCEIYVGRAPVSNEQEVSNFVMKTISYENSSDSYLSNALFAGEWLQTLPGGSNHWGGDSMDEIKDGSDKWGIYNPPFPSCFDIETLYDKEGIWSKSAMINKINNDEHIINHLGHANYGIDMKMYRSDADALNNDKYFFGYSQGCIAGDYSVNDCILEHFVVKNPTGAFAFIGNSRFGLADEEGTTNGPSQFYQRKFYDAVFGKKITNIGRANQYSKESLAGMIKSHTGGMRWVYYELNLLGDPETPLHINCSAFNITVECKNLTVCKNGSCDFTRIDDAVGAVCPGYRVDVRDNETYNGTLGLFGDNITLNCNGAKLSGNMNGTGIAVLSSDNSRIENCIIKNYTSGLLLSYSTNVTLINNSMENNTYNFDVSGLKISHYIQNIDISNKVNGKSMYYLVGETNAEIEDAGFVGLVSCNNITVSNSTLIHNGYGGIIINSSDSIMLNNNLTLNKYGIFTDHSTSGIEIINNNMMDMDYSGIYIKNSTLINISDNKINETIDGIYVVGSSKNRMFRNTISSNSNNGIILIDSQENEILNNLIAKNFDGIWVYSSSSNNSIFNNTLCNNTMRGIGVENNSSDNTLTNNTINYNNESGIYIQDNSNFNKISNNKISNNTVGIFSQNSNSTINNNAVCGNMQLDFNSTNWLSSSGDNNACDKADGWNDTNIIGCRNKCKASDIFDLVEMLEYLSGEKTGLYRENSYYKFVGSVSDYINLLDAFALIAQIVTVG